MTHFLGFFLAISIAISTGFGLTWIAVERNFGFGRISNNGWVSWPKAGTTDADPYTKAVVSRTGQIPLTVAEGISLQRSVDEKGTLLSGRCIYTIYGNLPPARLWTLAAYSPAGQLQANKAERYSLTSAEIVRDAAGAFELSISAQVQPGNWLPVAEDKPYVLVLRFYDTPLSSSASELDLSLIPAFRKASCL